MNTKTVRILRQSIACGLAILLSAAAARAGLPTTENLQQLPPGVNAIAVIDVETLLQSDVAKREKWKSKQDVNYGSRPLMVPPEARTVIVASQLNPSDDLKRQWQVSLIDLSESFTLEDIAKTEGGRIDPIGDIQAVWTPSDTCILQFDERTMAMAEPENRQAVSRWVAFAAKSKESALSDYLDAAMSRLTNESQFVLAIDLADVPQPHKVEERLAGLKMFSGRDMKRKEVADLIIGLQGLTATVSITDKIVGMLRVDFSDDVGPLGDLAKPLILQALDLFDAHLADLDGFDVELNGKSVTMTGPLSLDGLRRVGSLLQMGTTKFSDLQDAKPASDGSSDVVNASQAYFSSVTKLIDDLEKTLMDSRDNHALWMERYGKKIDSLPILNVDMDLLSWGANVAVTFREMGLAKRGAGIRGGVRKSETYGGIYNNGYGYYYQNKALADNSIKRQEEAKAQEVRFNSWKEIQDTREQMRIQLTEKYHVNFDF